MSVTSKLEGLRRLREVQAGGQWTGLKFHHITLSPPEGYAIRGENELDRTKEIVKVLLNEIGAETGAIFYHPYRLDEDLKADIFDEDDDGLTWADVLGLPGGMEDIEDFLSHEPHFHAIVLSRYVVGGRMTKQLQEKTGWNIERITPPGSSVSIGDKFDLARVAGYTLSHTGLYKTDSGRTRAGYWYFGEVANFTATQGVEDDMANAFAAVSERILGEEFAGVAREGLEFESDSEADEDGSERSHGHRYLPISRAGRYLSDGAWRDSAECVASLQLAVNYWGAMHVDRPALPPPKGEPEPEPDPPPEDKHETPIADVWAE